MRVIAQGLFAVRWQGDRQPRAGEADPAFPYGREANLAGAAEECCAATMPYPAPGCGAFRVECLICGAIEKVPGLGGTSDLKRVLVACRRIQKA